MAYKKKEVTPIEPEVKDIPALDIPDKDTCIPPLPTRFKGNKTIEGVWQHTPKLWKLYN